ncbi:MAG TPA: DUF3168 domain-containing protein [Paracoccaceae bacterium]|nr:DUF3168 domain-containing protein [Paracoccaceae bacterium]
MTYALAWPLQEAVFAALQAHAGVTAIVGTRIYDAAPHAANVPDPLEDYVTLGEELVRPFNTADGIGGTHDFAVTVHSGRDGFQRSKALAGAICDALIDAPLALSRGRLVALRFVQAQALRGRAPERRRVVLRFRAVIEDA